MATTQPRSARIPQDLRAGISALLILMGAGGTGLVVHGARTEALQRQEFVQAVASDDSTSQAIKIAMVMGAFYESSYRHIGVPYIDKLGKGRPLTVCNGITGVGVVAGRSYSPAECYALERGRYRSYEKWLQRDLPQWAQLPLFARATVLDFVHNKGGAAFGKSTMRRLLLAGDLPGACAQNERWNRGTVGGVSVVLPGLDVRAKANADLCLWNAPPPPAPILPLPELPGPVAEIPEPAPAPAAPPRPWWQRLFS